MHKLFLFLIVVVLSTNSICAQGLTESEISTTRNIQENLISNPEKAYRDAIKMSNSNNELFSFYGQYYIANYFYNKSDFDHSEKLLVNLIATIERSSIEKSSEVYQDLIAMCVNKLFYIQKNLGAYDKALFYLDKYQTSVANDRFNEQYGLLKVAMGDYVAGITLLKSALETTPHLKLGIGEKKAMNKKLMADKYNTIGEAYQNYYTQSKNVALLDSANFYFNKSARMLLEANFYPDYTRALLSMREAKSAALAGDYAKSLTLYRNGNKFPIVHEKIRTEQLFDLGMADCFRHLNQVDSAIIYCNKFLKSYHITKVSKENLLMSYNIMTQCYSEKKDTQNAYLYAQKSLDLIESIEKIKSKSLHFLHHYDLNNITQESNRIIASRNYFKFSLFLIPLISLSFALGFYRYYKLQKEKQKRFFNIIHTLNEAKTHRIAPKQIEKPETQTKQLLDEQLVEKITVGLKKLEHRETFLDPNFKLAFVAKKLNTNTAYLSQYFNQIIQKSFSEYTQELRIDYVLQKLKDTAHFRKYTLQAIAEHVGYKDANTLVRVFKKHQGTSLNCYIEELKNKGLNI